MQREGLIGFALLLTLAVLAPQGDGNSEAAAQMDAREALQLAPAVEALPAISLTGPANEEEDCVLHDLEATDDGSDVHLKFHVNVSI